MDGHKGVFQYKKVPQQCIIEVDGLSHGELCRNEKVCWVVNENSHRINLVLEYHPYSGVSFFQFYNFTLKETSNGNGKLKLDCFGNRLNRMLKKTLGGDGHMSHLTHRDVPNTSFTP